MARLPDAVRALALEPYLCVCVARLPDAVRAYKAHVEGYNRADWNAFMISLFGLEKVMAMKKPEALGPPKPHRRKTGACAGAGRGAGCGCVQG